MIVMKWFGNLLKSEEKMDILLIRIQQLSEFGEKKNMVVVSVLGANAEWLATALIVMLFSALRHFFSLITLK